MTLRVADTLVLTIPGILHDMLIFSLHGYLLMNGDIVPLYILKLGQRVRNGTNVCIVLFFSGIDICYSRSDTPR